MNFGDYLSRNLDNLFELSIEHLQLVVISMLLAIVISIPAGVLAYRNTNVRPLIVSSASVLLTIPSLALFGLFVPVFGLGQAPAIAALTLYALLPIIG
ncbi:MAG: ABC transporter permease, partial [Ornithinimicrobium sp.]